MVYVLNANIPESSISKQLDIEEKQLDKEENMSISKVSSILGCFHIKVNPFYFEDSLILKVLNFWVLQIPSMMKSGCFNNEVMKYT